MVTHYGRIRPKNYDFEYEKEIIERFKPRIPEKVFDSHFHISLNEIPDIPNERSFETWKEYTNSYLGGDRIKGGLIMCHPRRYDKKEDFDANRLFACGLAEEHEGFVSGLVVRPQDDVNETVSLIEKYPHIVALKPYRNYAIAENTYEADIVTYAPEWMWEIADHYGMCMVLHLSHYKDILSDPGNGEQIRYFCKKYPHVKLNLAHCALGHNPHKMKAGLHYLDGLDNIWMDVSGVGETLSIIYALKAIGPKRVMYASDGYNFAFCNSSRCFSIGGNFMALDADKFDAITLPPDYQFKPITPFAENLLSLFAAGDVCELTAEEWKDVFYNNAAKMFYPIIRK